MAIAGTNKVTNGSATDATSYATASITPAANALIVAWIGNQVASGTANIPTLSGNGLTWVQQKTVLSGTARRLTMFTARGASPSAGAVTIDMAGQTQMGAEWAIIEVTGQGGSTETDALVQVKEATSGGSSTSGSVTLTSAASDVNNRCVFGVRHEANEGVTPRTSWTELGDASHNNPAIGIESQIRTDAFEQTGSATWVTGSASQEIMAEILSADKSVTIPAPSTATASGPTPVAGLEAVVPYGAAVASASPPAPGEGYLIPAAQAWASAPTPGTAQRGGMPSSETWGSEDWSGFPWGPGERPFIAAPVIGRDEFPGELPPLEHRIIGPNGASDYPGIVAGFSADEDVGFATLTGSVEAERVRDQPDIYTDGAQWIVTDASTGLVVAGGDLLEPAIGGGAAALKADGWAKRLQRHGERLMYAARGYGGVWVPKNSEPYGPNGRGFYVQAEDKFQVTADGALRWHINKGTDGWSIGDQHGFVADFTGLRPGVRRITGHVHASFDGPNFKLRASTADSPSGGLSGYVTVHDFSGGGTDYDFDVDLPIAAPILEMDLYRTTDGATGANLEVTVTDLVVYGIATDSRWSASDVGRDIAGRLGFAMSIEESVFNVLPLDGGVDGVYADPLDLASLLSGMFYRVVGLAPSTPILEMRRVGAVRWEVIDPEFPVEPIPLPRYDSVLIPYTLSNGVAQSVLEVTSDTINRPRLPIARAYGPVSLPDPLPSADNAMLLGQMILERVYRPRFGGRATFSRVYGNGGFATAHEVHAQDELVLPLNAGVVATIKSLHREGGYAEATFDESVASVDRLISRKTRQTLLRNPK